MRDPVEIKRWQRDGKTYVLEVEGRVLMLTLDNGEREYWKAGMCCGETEALSLGWARERELEEVPHA